MSLRAQSSLGWGRPSEAPPTLLILLLAGAHPVRRSRPRAAIPASRVIVALSALDGAACVPLDDCILSDLLDILPWSRLVVFRRGEDLSLEPLPLLARLLLPPEYLAGEGVAHWHVHLL
eukprot:CAMPEP_0115876834 /NCGR_PEP_ID=MMETSP0287-20121206/25892_1 /TAXON_ID=412157 /ORGANISM="Chrysochromulina rotalis, Strain UIO044" /LENGTH=118 /DNA_ID=CAMNT_0003332291 /DNA_START=168 /DNA_END=521 /DNA_ORIENTATION=-